MKNKRLSLRNISLLILLVSFGFLIYIFSLTANDDQITMKSKPYSIIYNLSYKVDGRQLIKGQSLDEFDQDFKTFEIQGKIPKDIQNHDTLAIHARGANVDISLSNKAVLSHRRDTPYFGWDLEQDWCFLDLITQDRGETFTITFHSLEDLKRSQIQSGIYIGNKSDVLAMIDRNVSDSPLLILYLALGLSAFFLWINLRRSDIKNPLSFLSISCFTFAISIITAMVKVTSPLYNPLLLYNVSLISTLLGVILLSIFFERSSFKRSHPYIFYYAFGGALLITMVNTLSLLSTNHLQMIINIYLIIFILFHMISLHRKHQDERSLTIMMLLWLTALCIDLLPLSSTMHHLLFHGSIIFILFFLLLKHSFRAQKMKTQVEEVPQDLIEPLDETEVIDEEVKETNDIKDTTSDEASIDINIPEVSTIETKQSVREELNLQRQYYEIQSEMIMEQQDFLNDMNHLKQLSEQQEQDSEFHEFIKHVQQASYYPKESLCDNPILSSLLYFVKEECRKANIKFHYSLSIPDCDIIDLCVILGALLQESFMDSLSGDYQKEITLQLHQDQDESECFISWLSDHPYTLECYDMLKMICEEHHWQMQSEYDQDKNIVHIAFFDYPDFQIDQ